MNTLHHITMHKYTNYITPRCMRTQHHITLHVCTTPHHVACMQYMTCTTCTTCTTWHYHVSHCKHFVLCWIVCIVVHGIRHTPPTITTLPHPHHIPCTKVPTSTPKHTHSNHTHPPSLPNHTPNRHPTHTTPILAHTHTHTYIYIYIYSGKKAN